MCDSDTHFVLQGVLKKVIPTGSSLMILIKSRENHCVKSVQIRSYFWSVFSCIRTEYKGKSPYSVRMQENTDQK